MPKPRPRSANPRTPNTFGERLYNLRLRDQMTQEQVAQRVNGVSRAAVATWEQNQTQPMAAKLTKLAAMFGVTPGYLLFGDSMEGVSAVGFDGALQAIRSCRWTQAEAVALKAMVDVQVSA